MFYKSQKTICKKLHNRFKSNRTPMVFCNLTHMDPIAVFGFTDDVQTTVSSFLITRSSSKSISFKSINAASSIKTIKLFIPAYNTRVISTAFEAQDRFVKH